APPSSPDASPRPEDQPPPKAPPEVTDAGAGAAPASVPPDPIALSAGVGPSLALGLAPRSTALGRVFASARRRQLSLELAVDASWPTTHTGNDGTGFVLERSAIQTAACGHVTVLSACLTATAGLLRAHGQGVDAPATSTGI